jgi:predicted methyltransferase MtxX (methanogen marker protein 4)
VGVVVVVVVAVVGGGREGGGGREKEAKRTLCFALKFKKTKRNGEITVPPVNFLQKKIKQSEEDTH